MTLAQQFFELLSLLLLLAGCILLHVRLRRPSSLSFLLSLAASAAWKLWGQSVIWQMLPTPPSTGTAKDLINFDYSQSIIAATDLALFLWVSGSFFIAVKAIRPLARHAA
jgi:uncharacterized Tic20 family protein